MRTTKILFCAVVCSIFCLGQPVYYARSVAGLNSFGDGGPATAARLVLPSRVTSDAAGNVYVSEGLGRIRKIAPDGTISSLATQQNGLASGDNGPAAEAGISSLFGITVSGNFLYIAQRVPCNIRRINLTTGIISNFAGNGTCSAGADGSAAATNLDFPGAITADRQGRIYITESTMVRRIDPTTGQIERFAGNGTFRFSGDNGPAVQAQLSGPLGLAVDAQGAVYISDTTNCRIRRVNAAGQIATIAGSATCGFFIGDGGPALSAQLASVADISLDSTGTQLYLVTSSQVIRRVNLSTGIIDRFAGTGNVGGPVNQENAPALQTDLRVAIGIHVDAAGNVLFADYSASRVCKVTPSGILTTFAGGPTFAGDGGPAQSASLTLPLEVIPEPGGGLLIAENAINRRLRRVSPAGVISTIAGTGAIGVSDGNGGLATRAAILVNALVRDRAGNIYAADGTSGTVRRIGTDGIVSQVGPGFTTLGGVALDPTEQFLYVSLTFQHRVVRITLANNTATTFAGAGAATDAGSADFTGDGGPAAQAKLSSPQRIAVDADGNVLVADSGNHRIRRITSNGDRIVTVAGNGSQDFSGDGNSATLASLPSPTGVAVDGAGNIYVSNSSAVFRVDKGTGRMNRIAGKTTRGNSPLGGPALQMSFNSISNVSADGRGVLYLSESFNGRVVALTPSTLATPAISGIITPGNFGAGTTLSSGGWMEIYGEKFATATREWAGSDFAGIVAPTTLGGVRVRVQGRDAFVQLISAGQVNAVVPDGIPAGNVTVEVVNGNGTSDTVTMVAAARGPYLLAPPAFSAAGKQYVVGVLPDAYVGPPGLIAGASFRAAKAGDRVVMYGVGFGAVTPNVAAGNIATVTTSLTNARVKIGGRDATVEFAGLGGGFVGLYQFNIVVPSGVTGDAKLEVSVDGVAVPQALYFTVQ